MVDRTYNTLAIRVQWAPTPGTSAATGWYDVEVHNHRIPRWWERPWKLFRVERPQFKSSIDEMRWAVDELHKRLHGGGVRQAPADFAANAGLVSTTFETLSLDRQQNAS